MAQAHHFPRPGGAVVAEPPRLPPPDFPFQSLVVSQPHSRAGGLFGGLGTSLALHAVLVVAVVIVPILLYEVMPEPGAAVRAFFSTPLDVAPPPPPPPPPAPTAAGRVVRQAPVEPRALDPAAFFAPIEVPDQIMPEAGLDLGVEGGVPGGVEGGVPGGVVGGVIGGVLGGPPPPPVRVVRIGGQIVAPKLVKKVPPVYPAVATQGRISGTVILEARVDVKGRVTTATVLHGHPLFDEAAVTAVTQWRYQPLLLNGEPTEFILTVTIFFNLSSAAGGNAP
jgi:periplasmic protein TonB